MTYVIFNKKGKPVLANYEYFGHSDSYLINYGTKWQSETFHGELPYPIFAELTYHAKYDSTNSGLFTKKYIYPENNILNIDIKNSSFSITPEEVTRMKGFKKFFDGKNITSISYSPTMKFYGENPLFPSLTNLNN